MNTKTQTENQRWEALRERIKELAIEPKLNYNTNQGDFKMLLQKHNQHVIDSLTVMCDQRIKDLPSDSPHGDYIYYSFQDAINEEKDEDNEWGEK